MAKLLLSIDALYVRIQLACHKIDIQVIITSQLATKLLTLENKPANFDTGDRAVLMPQLGMPSRVYDTSTRLNYTGDSWTTGKTLRLVLFRGGKGDDLRYAHASSSNVADEDYPWVRFDITVCLCSLFIFADFQPDGLPCDLLDVTS